MSKSRKYINLLTEFLPIPALSRQEDKRADFLETYLTGSGYQVQRLQNNLLVSTDGRLENKKLLLNSHIDTVSPSAGWQSDPFYPEQKDGMVIGLGSNDAGASVVCLLAAFDEFARIHKASEILLLISSEEEISGKNGMEAVIPLLKSIKFAIVGEPTGMQVAVAERGLMVIDCLAKGKGGHAARNEGVNAIYLALEDISRIKGMQFPDKSAWLPDPGVSVTMISAGANHNVVPGECSFVIDSRSNDKYPNEKLLGMIKAECKSEIKERSLHLNASFLVDDHPVFGLLKKSGFTTFGSATMSDMALLPFPAIKMGPGDSARSHTAGEYILEAEIEDAIPGYIELINGILISNI